METLDQALVRLKTWLSASDNFPGWKDVRVIEIGRGTQFQGAEGTPGTRYVAESAVFAPSSYAPRFEELLSAGYSWLNLSLYGMLGETAIIAVEIPRASVGTPTGRTSVNLSGPPGSRWNAEGYVHIVTG
jgi:hypothetical protein